MRGYTALDDEDTDYERSVNHACLIRDFDEDWIIPKIFQQFEKEYLTLNEDGSMRRPNFNHMMQKFGLSYPATKKLFRICQKRKSAGLNLI